MKNIAILVFLVGRFEPPQIWRLEVPAMPPADAAELAFKLSNAPPEFLAADEAEIMRKFPRTRLRSISVGDILIHVDSGAVWMVNSCGFVMAEDTGRDYRVVRPPSEA